MGPERSIETAGSGLHASVRSSRRRTPAFVVAFSRSRLAQRRHSGGTDRRQPGNRSARKRSRRPGPASYLDAFSLTAAQLPCNARNSGPGRTFVTSKPPWATAETRLPRAKRDSRRAAVELRRNTNAGFGPRGGRSLACRNPTKAEVSSPIGAAAWVSREDLLHRGRGTGTLVTVVTSRLGVAGLAVTRALASTRDGRRRTTRRSGCRRESGCVGRGYRALARTSRRALGALGRSRRSRAFAPVCARS